MHCSTTSLDGAHAVAQRVFASTYGEARQKFLVAAPHAKAYASRAAGPGGERLFTDTAYFGPTGASNLIVLVSGTHGPEGYCGSASQLAFLEAGFHQCLPADTAVLMIHALNSYGFAWDRRWTLEGVDLNRNFVDFSQPLPPNPGYDALSEHFNPADISEAGLREAELALQAYRDQHGEEQFQVARKSGQYTVPGGMGYGGDRPTEARCTLEQIARDHGVAERAQVFVIDYHTGLGPYGYGELQCEMPSGVAGYRRAEKIWGSSVTSPIADIGNSSSCVIHGCQDAFWEGLLGPRHTYVALEYGTYDPDSARRTGRNDIWLFKHRPDAVDTPLGREIRSASKAHFYPEKPDWKEMVVGRSHQVHRQLIEFIDAGQKKAP